MNRQYIAIDLKSFYASVECVERGLDPLDACMVVADRERSAKTICLAVSPALKAFGIPGRPRLFEVVSRVKEINVSRGHTGYSTSGHMLARRPDLAVDFLVAPPRMQLYMDYSARIYDIYMQFVAPEDIHVYSVDEVFIDVTPYLKSYRMTAHELAMTMIRAVLAETGITATAGIGSNLYLCKVAMDIVAKKMPPDKDGVRIAELDEAEYRRQLWNHMPLTDFWRIGRAVALRLERLGIFTMGDLARASLGDEASLYKEFGVNAELLIDHAWGWEPVTIECIKAYRPMSRSVSHSQVLAESYNSEKTRNVVLEMAETIALDLTSANMLCSKLLLTIGYDSSNLSDTEIAAKYHGRITNDHYGRPVPAHAHGSLRLPEPTASARIIYSAMGVLFDRIVNTGLKIRRINVCATDLISKEQFDTMAKRGRQLSLFDYHTASPHRAVSESPCKDIIEREMRRQQAVIHIKRRFGKNALLRGLNFTDGATQRLRNIQIGGHKA